MLGSHDNVGRFRCNSAPQKAGSSRVPSRRKAVCAPSCAVRNCWTVGIMSASRLPHALIIEIPALATKGVMPGIRITQVTHKEFIAK